MVNHFKTLISEDVRFGLTLDEYTSIKNERYMNINVHQKNIYWSLGLIKIVGSLSSAKIMQLVGQRLADFNLDFDKHIVGCTTDGGSVRVKFGKEILVEHQQCLAHAIHLAISSVLYKKKLHSDQCEIVEGTEYEEAVLVDDIESGEMSDEEGDISSATAKEISSENEEEASEDLGSPFSNILILGLETDRVPLLQDKFHTIINKVRKICRIFRKSPLKNEKLQDFVKDQHGKELKLILDCKTRWNSLLCMIERFLKLKQCIPKALRVIRSTETISIL